jgi:ornithine cyclodeaminase
MTVLILNHDEVEQLLEMNDCIDVMAEALHALAREQSFVPLRPVVRPPAAPGFMGLMPGWSEAEGWGLKVVNIYPENPKRGLDAHQGAVLLFDGQTGETRAVMNASAITAIRTAAVSGVATRLLAREDARVLAVLGAGVQARSHLQAMSCAMRVERTLLWARDAERARAVAADFDGVEVVEDCEQAVRAADVVCTTTSAREPILRREWLKPGTHVNAVGSSVPTTRELDTQTAS